MNLRKNYFHLQDNLSASFDLLWILGIWSLSVWISQPWGDFPLNDDWSYAIAVKRWLDTGAYIPTPWTSMTLISHVFWGGLFCKVLGFSFNVLRLSTWVAGIGIICMVYFYCHAVSQDRFISRIATLSLAFNPLFFNLSLNFMTDITAMFFNMATIGFMIHYLLHRSDGALVLSAIGCIASLLVRQNGLFLPIAFLLACLVIHPFSFKNLIKSAFPLVTSWGALHQFEMWMDRTGRTPSLYGLQIHAFQDMCQRLKDHFWTTSGWMIENIASQLIEIGVFLLPFSLLGGFCLFRKAKIVPATMISGCICLTVGFLTAFAFLIQGKTFPLIGNILHKGGIGPLTLHDTYILGFHHYRQLPPSLWKLVTAFGGFGMGTLLWIIFESVRTLTIHFKNRSFNLFDGIPVFIYACLLVYMIPLSLIPSFDRYLILPIALLCITIASDQSQSRLLGHASSRKYVLMVAVPLLLLQGIYAVGGTHDYFSWNRARWKLIQDAVGSGIPPSNIDAGFEFNGLVFYGDTFQGGEKKDSTKPPIQRNHPRSWWWVTNDEYLVAFGSISNTQILKTESFTRWLPFSMGKLFFLKRNEIDGAGDSQRLAD